MNIYYYHPLNLTFTSAQTLQIIKDYLYLSRCGHKIHLYGTYLDKKHLLELKTYIKNDNISILIKKDNNLNRAILKLIFLTKIIKNNENKLIVTRSIKKTSEVLFLKIFFKNNKIIQEFHEEAFPHLIKRKNKNLKRKFSIIIKKIDGILFTNYSQKILFEKEFTFKISQNIVLPNGVEIEKFSKAKRSIDNSSVTLTYLGQFNKWKNIELIFEAFSLIKKENIYLKIAGGKNNSASTELIYGYVKKYNIDPSKIIFLGFIENSSVAEKVLNNSSILLLPLGNNYQSKYLTSPMKLFEYMATKIPVLSVDFPSVNLITKNNEIFLSQCNAKDFYKEILKILSYPENKLEKKINTMNVLANKYSYKKRSEKYDKFIRSLCL